MAETYEDALRTIADCYGKAIAISGGMSLARIATLVVNRGSFFQRLSQDTSFSAKNLDRLAAWFRNEENWPHRDIPRDAADALFSIGRPPLLAAPCGSSAAPVHCDREDVPQELAAETKRSGELGDAPPPFPNPHHGTDQTAPGTDGDGIQPLTHVKICKASPKNFGSSPRVSTAVSTRKAVR